MNTRRKGNGYWVVSFSKKHAPPFLVALLSTGVTRVRVMEKLEYWYFRLPDTRAAYACWYGFLAGKRNRLGYIMGGSWPPAAPDQKLIYPSKKKNDR